MMDVVLISVFSCNHDGRQPDRATIPASQAFHLKRSTGEFADVFGGYYCRVWIDAFGAFLIDRHPESLYLATAYPISIACREDMLSCTYFNVSSALYIIDLVQIKPICFSAPPC